MKSTTLLAAAGIFIVSCSTVPKHSTTPSSKGEIAFEKTVKPLFESRCVWCHRNTKALGGLNFQDRASTLDPERRFVIPRDPSKSRIYQAVSKESTHPRVMPGDGWGITKEQESAIHDWILDGAPWPEGREGKIHRKTYRVDHDDYR